MTPLQRTIKRLERTQVTLRDWATILRLTAATILVLAYGVLMVWVIGHLILHKF